MMLQGIYIYIHCKILQLFVAFEALTKFNYSTNKIFIWDIVSMLDNKACCTTWYIKHTFIMDVVLMLAHKWGEGLQLLRIV